MGVSKAIGVRCSSRWVPWSMAGDFGGLHLCFPTAFPGNFSAQAEEVLLNFFRGSDFLVLLGIRIRGYYCQHWFQWDQFFLIPGSERMSWKRGRTSQRPSQWRRRSWNAQQRYQLSLWALGWPLQLSPKFCGNQTYGMIFLFLYPALSWCKAFHGKREEEETIKSWGEATAGEHHQQVSPWIGIEMGSAGLDFSSWVIPEFWECHTQLCFPCVALIIKVNF